MAEFDRAFAFGDAAFPGLAKLNEECGEVIQVIGKLMMTHGNPAHWSGNLRAQLIEKLGDLSAALQFVGKHCLTGAERMRVRDRIEQKLAKFENWHADMDADPPPPLEDSDNG
jgi:NTP pyrophosphatase (non-canonical NTP hydrolase)